ncbi:1,6-anhydro-N-acetylmuramyl-L-alanine amidase AmpD [Vibrio sp. SS-MA-C1-2]|uniref:1,6-anhydro-N-acetylmuramyl-L-alanine amidase AmpD n=1 Tax=Vibrio sp. SS-MA-C1-2 TaxID=2908646 RepID=UPI001F190145|nr:1,6-anhydro-N-acetylmuramyl-L-alanine amidase AmpD [Vibrio sp. SS-MA-C1-2]UJF20099.1 1,6-anhydro-N-acetylmuramyl-L-alanine amidase AmpD [Vibrio sp. SS-MA-C1-2]
MIDDQHWLVGVTKRESPFYDQRPNEEISLLVIHNISLPPGEFGGPYIEDLFLGTLDTKQHPFFSILEGLEVSAHCLIRRDGEVIQFVPFNGRAWHAGKSSFAGQQRCNDFAIGIELEGTDTTAYTEIQYQVLQHLANKLVKKYPKITKERMTGHQFIAADRKTDPGLIFDWSKLKYQI